MPSTKCPQVGKNAGLPSFHEWTLATDGEAVANSPSFAHPGADLHEPGQPVLDTADARFFPLSIAGIDPGNTHKLLKYKKEPGVLGRLV